MQTYICDICGHEWTVEVPPAPVSCPVCGTDKIANKPGGIKPIPGGG